MTEIENGESKASLQAKKEKENCRKHSAKSDLKQAGSAVPPACQVD